MSSEVQRSRSCPRRRLWRGIPGQSFATTVAEEAQVLEDKEHVLRPMPIIEMEIKQMNMKSYIGTVLQLADGDGNIIEDAIAYCHLIDAMKCNTEWIVISEHNKDGIFHVHGLVKNNFRTDSWRRSIQSAWNIMSVNPQWINKFGTGCTMDCLKCQKAHKPGALMEYMTKDPVWICGNTDRILQLSYDMVMWDMGARFAAEPEPKPINLDAANPMISELLGAITMKNCKSLEDLMRAEPDLVVKYLHRPGFQAVVQNCLTYAKCTKANWKLSVFQNSPCDPSTIHAFLLHQGVDIDRWDLTFYRWITKQNGKKNTICIEGPSNTGKTSLFIGLKQICPCGEIVNAQNFNYEGLYEQYWGVWDEPLCADEQAEKFKQIAGGEPCAIPIKHKKPVQLPQMPILITTNRPFWFWCPTQEAMFRNRFELFYFKFDATASFFPRSRSTSCECEPCLYSSQRQASVSRSTTGRLPRRKQSKKPMAPRHDTTTNVMGSGSMRQGGKCTAKSPRGSGRGESSTSGQLRISCSTTISSVGRSDTSDRSSNTNVGICSTSSRDEKYVDRHDECRGIHSDDNRRSPISNRRGDVNPGGDPTPSTSSTSMVSLGTATSTQSEMEDEIQSKKSRLARPVAAMRVPTKHDWQNYLSFLYHIFEKKPMDLTCYESSLSDTEDE
uniref:Nonstructural protein 1 n=1 Tax=Cygnus atratus Chaphamaparvovirus TaxID=2794485 RepID=A0A8A4XDF7_9VIRU|nr:MAG: nonstructural protein 1 [Cygnus atratus Chaphamaparvovirus]